MDKKIIFVTYNDYNRGDEEYWFYDASANGFKGAVDLIKEKVADYYGDSYERLILPYDENPSGGFRWSKEVTYDTLIRTGYLSFDDCNDIYFSISLKPLHCCEKNIKVE